MMDPKIQERCRLVSVTTRACNESRTTCNERRTEFLFSFLDTEAVPRVFFDTEKLSLRRLFLECSSIRRSCLGVEATKRTTAHD